VEFEAEVLKTVVHEDKTALILDQTCFYPESGGQPSDQGTIDGVKVVKVLEEDSQILHLLEEEIFSRKVKGKIDWPIRFDHMQQHSGQHILSQSFCELLKGETVSFHLGEEVSTLEIGLTKISEEEVEKVEKLSNEIIFQDKEIKTYFVPEDRIKEIALRRPPKKEGLIRVVEVSGFDYSACGGTHCRRSGEIGLIKITKWERIRNNLRFEFLCGARALSDYGWKTRDLKLLANQMTSSEKEVFSSLQKLFLEVKSLKKKIRKLQERIAFYEAQDTIARAEGKIIKGILVDRSVEEARLLALNIIRQGDYVVLYALKTERGRHLVFACSENLKLDLREVIPLISSLTGGRGGGSSSLVEIATDEKADLELVLARAEEFVKSKGTGTF